MSSTALFLIEVDPANALDAFNHPYVYVDELVALPGLRAVSSS